ncbi:hypothetical protein LOK49_LG01G00131 [Camellia lanceoleosa]|uniref:Uncharacterized protein n=1 Tax=Camellia lanceoleosa TaxID=1840588 RepID=A0ACC0J101_9ERIC|nr:hypothetical protein LOK49_LG01G00131 [Camellia lanceoleosa]
MRSKSTLSLKPRNHALLDRRFSAPPVPPPLLDTSPSPCTCMKSSRICFKERELLEFWLVNPSWMCWAGFVSAPLDHMACLLVIQGMLNNLIKIGTNVELVRKDKFKDAVWTLWKTASGIDGLEMKTEIIDIASDVRGINVGLQT